MQCKESGLWDDSTMPSDWTTEQKSIDIGIRVFYSHMKTWGVQMADKYYKVADMASSVAERITQNADTWTEYLETAARLYRYGFKDQLLIYAQRPDATAVASIEVWNTRMHCWVNQGAKGIALLDDTRKKKLRYVFDISDVHKAKRIGIFPNLWEMKEQHHEAVMKRLEDIYGKTDEKRPIESRMIQIAEHIAEDYTPDVLQDLVNVQDDSLLYGLDEYNLSLRLKDTMASSIAYTLMARCGLDTDTYKDELDFSYIREFSTLDSLSVLGEATSSMCEPVLREICQVVEDIDRENARRVERESGTVEKDEKTLANGNKGQYNTLKRESETLDRYDEEGGTDYGTDIQQGRGLSDSKHRSERGAGGEPDEVRNAPGDISEGTSQGDLHRETPVWDTDGALSDGTETGRGEIRETEKSDDGERGSDRGAKEQRSDGVGSPDELDSEQSGRDRSVGDSLQSVVEVEYKQFSIFSYLDEQMGTIAAAEAGMNSIAPAAFSLNESDIEDILRTGGGNSNSRERIYEKYRENRTSSYVQHRVPLHKKAVVNKYTAEGRKEIHKQLETVDIERVHELMRNPISNETVEFNDNCVSLFVAQRGKCAICKLPLTLENMRCVRKIPKSCGGDDKYNNLIIVHKEMERLIKSQDNKEIKRILNKYKLESNQRRKVNTIRKNAGLEEIDVKALDKEL